MMDFPHRHAVQQYLTSQTTQGVIVELGCGHGNGVIAMSKGNVNKLRIFSVDPYLPYADPLGGKYGLETLQQMRENTKGIEFEHISQNAENMVRWPYPIGLLWVDLSMVYDDLWPIVRVWEGQILSGGYLGITGLEYWQLGTRKIYDEIAGYDKVLTEQDLVAVLRKI